MTVEDNETIYLNARHTGQENGPQPWGRVTGYSYTSGNDWTMTYNSQSSPIGAHFLHFILKFPLIYGVLHSEMH